MITPAVYTFSLHVMVAMGRIGRKYRSCAGLNTNSIIIAQPITAHSPVLSKMVTNAVSTPTTTSSDPLEMLRMALKNSSSSTNVVLMVVTDRWAVVIPAGIMTVKVPPM